METTSGIERIAPRRFLAFFAVLIVSWAIGPLVVAPDRAVLIGFDLAAIVFLASCIPTLQHAPADMRVLAKRSDANRKIMLVITLVLTVVVFVAILSEVEPREKLALVDKLQIFVSLALAWTFANTVYALHYAHLFYSRQENGDDRGGLQFPGTSEPLMSDFAYFSFTLGVAVQTSDVQVTSRHIRNVVTFHSIVGFFFNLGALALAINVLGGG